MLPPFRVRNLLSEQSDHYNTIVCLTARSYDLTISRNPKATLKYDDEEGDVVTIGSSLELVQRLEEVPSSSETRLSKPQPPIESQISPYSTAHHVFDIDHREEIQTLWQGIQKSAHAGYKNRELTTRRALDSEQNDLAGLQSFEDYRTHHFNATRPPQLYPLDVACGMNEDHLVSHAEDIFYGNATTSPMAHLTVEGKRQAQAAGDKLRARSTPSRHRKSIVASIDRSSHHNRWASYKTTNSAFLCKDLGNMSIVCDRPTLVSEGKSPVDSKDTQTSDDKSRCRTNPIRHYRSDRPGPSEHEINKNRGSAGNRTHPTSYKNPKEGSKAEARINAGSRNQPSLLEVFEAELSKGLKDLTGSNEGSPTSTVRPTSFTSCFPQSDSQRSAFDNVPMSSPIENTAPPVSVSSTVDSGLVDNHHKTERSRDASNAIELGIRAAVEGFEKCLRGIVDTLQAAQLSKNSDSHDIESSIAVLRALTGAIATSRGSEKSVQGKTTEDTGINVTSAPQAGKQSQDSNVDSQKERAPSGSRAIVDEAISRVSGDFSSLPHHSQSVSSELNEPQREMGRILGTGKSAFGGREGPSQCLVSDIITSGPYRYHKPGPIHLPPHATLTNGRLEASNQTALKNAGYVDRLRHSQSTEAVMKPQPTYPAHRQRTSDPMEESNAEAVDLPPIATTRFPTLAQFEGSSHFGAPTKFPPLPSMETLVPMVASNKTSASHQESNEVERETSILVSQACDMPKCSQSAIEVGPKCTESSGDFFNRATGISKRSAGITTRLTEPFNHLKSKSFARTHLENGIRRNATVAGFHHRKGPTIQRPYSKIFSGDGRKSWDAFLGDVTHSKGGRLEAQTRRPGQFDGNRAGGSRHCVDQISTKVHATRRPSEDDDIDEYHRTRTNATSDGRIQNCVSQLMELGFRGMDDSRLVFYAETVDGNCEEAVDVILEEQQAYNDRV